MAYPNMPSASKIRNATPTRIDVSGTESRSLSCALKSACVVMASTSTRLSRKPICPKEYRKILGYFLIMAGPPVCGPFAPCPWPGFREPLERSSGGWLRSISAKKKRPTVLPTDSPFCLVNSTYNAQTASKPAITSPAMWDVFIVNTEEKIGCVVCF